MKIIDLVKFVLAVLLLGASIALAVFDPVNDDTDIFLNNPTYPGQQPNVLIVLDNSANWNQPFTNEKNALVQVANGLTEQFNVGLMIMSDSNIKRSGPTASDGAYMRYHTRRMTFENRTALANVVSAMDINGDKGDNALTGLALHEAYLYFAGKPSLAGDDQGKADHDGTSDTKLAPLTGHALPGAAAAAFPTENSLYRSPITDGCQRNFIIYISNGPAQENATARASLEAKLGTLTGVSPPSVIGITPGGLQANWADEMAKFMANADVFATSASIPNSEGVQNVYTYVIEVDPGTTGSGPDMTALMKSVAANGKGKYFGVTSNASGTAIVDALNSILIDVQAVNSVFASTTLPVSVNVRGTNLNQVYIGVFRPDQNKSPRWLGNLKMYNLALNSATGAVYLADAANDPPPHSAPPPIGNPAENTTTGFVSQSSPSFWTTSSSFWGFRDPSQNGPGGASDLPDGDLVEKGGAAQQLRIAFPTSQDARNLFTCTTGLVNGTSQTCTTNSALSNTPFNTLNDAIDAASLQLDTRFVSPLTAFMSQPVTTLSDRLRIEYFTNTFGTYVQSIGSGNTTATITSLTTAVPKPITSLSGLVPNVQTVAITSVAKASGVYRFQAAAALPGVYTVGAVVTIKSTSNALFNNNSYAISAVDAGNNRFSITGGPSGNETATGGTATVTSGTVASTTAQAHLPAHGYLSGQSVTIQGASPTEFNGTYNVTVIDTDHFNYTISAASGNASGTITASGNTTTATATTTGHSFLAGTTVNVSGASIAAYNGAKTILTVAGNTFTYTVPTAIGPEPNTTGLTAFQGTNTEVTVRIQDWWGYWCSIITGGAYPGSLLDNCGHDFVVGDTIFISGSDVSGYNGQFTVTSVIPPAIGEGNSRSFTYTSATPLPTNASFNVSVSKFLYNQFAGYAWNHNLKDGDKVAIENPDGPDAITGIYEIYYVSNSDYYFAIVPTPVLPPITKTNYTIRPIGGTNGVTGGAATPPQAYAFTPTIWPGHGYPNGQEVRIDNASPSGYNGTKTIRVCDGTETFPDRFGGTTTKTECSDNWFKFTYPLTASLGPNTNLGVTSSIKSTTARATAVNHGFADGSTVSISGATPGAFNGSYVVTVPDANTFTYTIGSLEGDASGTVLAAQTGGFSAERDLIIKWVRGQDNFADENANLSSTDIRASVHGDVLHSRPAVINYNRFTGSDDDVFVFYGGNDGIFHAVKGGYTTPSGFTPTALTPGREAWGFVPQEFFGQFKRMRNNAPTISSAFKKPYFMDGPIGVLTKDNTVPPNGKLGDIASVPDATAQPASDIVNLYIANRRGGRFLYALDVNTPTDPKFLWKITNASTGFSELGQTWSQPAVVTNLAALTVPVLVFGAGYDPAVEDLDPAVVTSVNATNSTASGVEPGGVVTSTVGTVNRGMGRGIYVVNALTGALIWSGGKFTGATTNVPEMHYAIPSDVTVIRPLTGGAPNRAYVGDTGGNMWRIDFVHDSSAAAVAANPDNLDLTTVTKLASVADQSTAAGRRKFLFPPDVVGQDGFDAVLIGSGDREHPFDSTVTNRFYMFKDKGGDPTPVTGAVLCDPTITEGSQTADASCTPVTTIAGMTDLTSNCLQDASACLAGETQANVSAKLGTDRGWYITLLPGEKVVGNAISISGTTFFNTNQPSATAGGGTCGSNLGIARQYQVATADATATSDLNAVGGLTGADRSLIHAGGGYLPSPVHVVVMLGGKPVEAIISGIQVSTPAGTTLSSRLRKYWYRELDVQ